MRSIVGVEAPGPVLVVDDDPVMCAMLLEQLAHHGFPAKAAGSVDAALEILEAEPLAAILSDIQMASRDGFDLLEQVLRHGSSVPVVLMSAFARRGTKKKALSEGAFAFLDKPFREEELLAVL